MASKTVLIAGANGYIGREVCLAFRKAGWTVYGVCRTKEKFNQACLAQEEIIPVISDYTKDEELFPFVKKVDVLVECASTTQSKDIIELMLTLLKKSGNCVDGTKKMYIQTTGFMQYQFEQLVLEQKDIITTVVRPAFVYGKSGGIVFEQMLFKKPLEGEKLNIAGNKDKLWGWCHVTDLANFYVLAAQRKNEANGQIFKVGKLIQSCTYERIMKAIAKCMKIEVKYDGPAEGYEAMLKDLHMAEFDNKNTLEFGWKPIFSCDPIEQMQVHYDAFLAWQGQK